MQGVATPIQQELRSDETLIWSDRPDPNECSRAWLTISLFGIVFFLFSIFWTYGSFQAGAGVVFSLFGLPFVVVGGGLTFSPLWQNIVARGQFYAITNQRLVIVTTWPWHKVQSFNAHDICSLERKWVHKDGRGTILFAPDVTNHMRLTRQDWGFYGVRDVRYVEETIRKLKQGEDLDFSNTPSRAHKDVL